jgi:hypothetical protein
MPKKLNVILLLLYCHFTLAGFPGAYLMRHAEQLEKRTWADVTTPDGDQDATDGVDEGGGQDCNGKCSPGDPDQCHRSGALYALQTDDRQVSVLFQLLPLKALPTLSYDIQTPPPER